MNYISSNSRLHRGNILGFELNHNVKIDLGIDNVPLNNLVRLIGKKLKQAEINIVIR